MRQIYLSILCTILCYTTIYSQTNTSTTAFTGCPNVYVAGFKNGTNCTAAPYSVYTVDLTGGITSTLFTLPSGAVELNGIGISSLDNRGYALLFDRTPATTASACIYSNIKLIRFGANGVYESLGSITPPPGGVVLTPLGAVDASGNYLFGATNSAGNLLYVGKISNIGSLMPGAASVTASYTPVTTLCAAVYADWAVSPQNNNLLYTYGIYNDRINGGTTTMQRPTGTLMRIDLTTQTVTCIGAQTYNPAYFTDTSDDNFAGVMYGADGFLYGMNVKDRKFYKIDPATGVIAPVGSLAGSGQLRGDLGSCASYIDVPTPFTTCPDAYLIGFKNGYNCTADSFKVYTSDISGNLSATPLFGTPDNVEINGIGISKTDSKAYAIQFDRVAVGNDCIASNVRLLRFGANGARELLGVIPPPSATTAIVTALGTVDGNDNYLFGAANATGTELYLGKIANISTLTPASIITPTYSLVINSCPGRIFADWAVSPIDGNLYTYGIYPTSATTAAGTLMTLNLTTNVLTCIGTQNTTEFSNASQENFAGVMFGSDGNLYGMNVATRKYYRINPVTGVLVQVNTIPGGLSYTPHLRGDMGSCVSYIPPTSFNTCPKTYIVGFKDGYTCDANPYSVYTMNLAGTLSPTPLFTTSTTEEVNGIGVAATDGKAYAMLFDRVPAPTSPPCTAANIRFFRFGANGSKEILGIIPAPTTGVFNSVNTAFGAIDANGTYYFIGNSVDGLGQVSYSVGKIANVQSLIAGNPIVPVYSTITRTCSQPIFADWAIYPADNNFLYSYGIYNNGGVVTGTLMKLDLTTNVLTCLGTPNTTEFTDANQDNFGGIMFGDDGYLYGMNVATRKFYRIDPASGFLTYVSTIPGGVNYTPQLRGDMASCASYIVPPTPFDCPNAYVIGFKNGFNCTADSFKVYITNLAGNIPSAPIISMPDVMELNGIGISKADKKGYAIQFDRIPNGSSCTYINVRLVRFGANGSKELLGFIPLPPNLSGSDILIISTALGTVDANDNYYFGASRNGVGLVGKIANISMLTAASTITPTYSPVSGCTNRIFADWAINPVMGNGTLLYTYGIYDNAGVTTGTLMSLDLTTNTYSCFGAQTTGIFTSVQRDNFAGIMFGTDGMMYGMNVANRKFYRINPSTGVLTEISTIPGGINTTPELRGDLGSCVTEMMVLPISYSNVSVASGGECKAVVNWDASGVEAGDIFTLEKSYDGRSFSTVASVRGVTVQTNYSVTDSKTGITNYYRIKGVSKDGTEKYSSVVRFLSSCGGKNNATLFNNLITAGSLNGEVSLYKTQSVSYNIINGAGAKVFSKTAVTSAGVSRFNFNVPALAKGVYLLQIVMGEETKTQKFVVQ